MTAKEYLSQAYRIDQRINSKLEQVMSLREQAEKATATINPMPRPASPNQQSMEATLVKLFSLESEINDDIDTLVDLKRDIVRRIKRLNNPEQELLLEQRYLCFKRWEQIAVDMEYSTQHVFRLHDLALGKLVVPESGE